MVLKKLFAVSIFLALIFTTALTAFSNDSNKKFDTNTEEIQKYIAEQETKIGQAKNKKSMAEAKKEFSKEKKSIHRQQKAKVKNDDLVKETTKELDNIMKFLDESPN